MTPIIDPAAGLVSAAGQPYLMRVSYLARFSPFRAVADLRVFLSHRQPHELWFGILAIVLTALHSDRLRQGFARRAALQIEHHVCGKLAAQPHRS